MAHQSTVCHPPSCRAAPTQASTKQGAGYRKAKGALRGVVCTVEMRTVAELSGMRELVGGRHEAKDRWAAPRAASRAPPAAHSHGSCSHERSGGYARSEINMCVFQSNHMHAAHAATPIVARTFRGNDDAQLIWLRSKKVARPSENPLSPAKGHAHRGASRRYALYATCTHPL